MTNKPCSVVGLQVIFQIVASLERLRTAETLETRNWACYLLEFVTR